MTQTSLHDCARVAVLPQTNNVEKYCGWSLQELMCYSIEGFRSTAKPWMIPGDDWAHRHRRSKVVMSWFRRDTEGSRADDEAKSFAKSYVPKDGADCEWVKSYAHFIFDKLVEADRGLETKAENMVKLLGGGTGLLTLGALANLSRLGTTPALVFAIGLCFALVAVVVAVRAREPQDSFLPPDIKTALEYADAYENVAEARFQAQWHWTCEKLKAANVKKARSVAWAFRWATIAIATITLSFLVAIFTMDRNDKPASDGGQSMAEEQAGQSQGTNSESPSASSQPASANPATQAQPQTIQKTHDPASKAEPQVYKFSRDGHGERFTSDE